MKIKIGHQNDDNKMLQGLQHFSPNDQPWLVSKLLCDASTCFDKQVVQCTVITCTHMHTREQKTFIVIATFMFYKMTSSK